MTDASPGSVTPAQPEPVPAFPRRTVAERLARRRGWSYRLANWVERRRFQRDLPAPLRARIDAGELALLRLSGRLRVVDEETLTTSGEAARHNRDLVLDQCALIGIDYFVVPAAAARRFRVAISDPQDWDRLVGGLLELGDRVPLYIGIGTHGRSGAALRWPALVSHPLVRQAAAGQRALEVFQIQRPRGGGPWYDRPWACQVEYWPRQDDGSLTAPERNGRTRRLGSLSQQPAFIVQAGRTVPTVEPFTHRQLFDVDFPIDAVYMWVDGDDPRWQQRKQTALDSLTGSTTVHGHGVNDARFRDLGELRYSLRSLELYAPWIRHRVPGDRPAVPGLVEHCPPAAGAGRPS